MNRALAIVSLVLVSAGVFVGSGVGAGAVWWALSDGQATSFDNDQPPGAPVIPGVVDDDEEPDYTVIGFGSIGAINTTQTAEQAIDILGSGQTNDIENAQCSGFLLGMRDNFPSTSGLAESQGANGPLDTLTLSAGWDGDATVYGENQPRTSEGITLGSTLDELVAAYPGQLTIRDHLYYASGKYVDLEGPGNTGMLFSTNDDGLVESITTGNYPQVQYPEGCH